MIALATLRPRLTALLVAALVGGCSPSTGDLGGVATPLPTSASPDIPTLEPSATPPETSIPPGGSPEPTPSSTNATPEPSAAGTTVVRAYFFLGSFTGTAGLTPVLRVVPRTQAVGAAAMSALLSGPSESELAARPAMYTVVPPGTRFLGLHVANGVATVDLSREFEAGGDSASVLGRLGQVVYTLTQFPTVQRVQFQVEGEPLTVFGGEGMTLDGPVGRDDYLAQLAPIFVDRPAWGATIDNPVRISGTADEFEAQFLFQLVDGSGRTLAEGPIHASCGTGCRGTFDISVPYDLAASGRATLRVFNRSAADGSVEDLVEYPVVLK